MRYATLDNAGHVTNVILWDGSDNWQPPDGVAVLPCPEDVGPGWSNVGGEWTAPAIVPEPPIVPTIASKLGLKRALDEIGRWSEIKAMIEGDAVMAEDWSLAVEIRRTDPIFAVFVTSGSFTGAEIDAVFQRAVEIVA